MLCVSCFVWLFFVLFLFQKNVCLNKLVHAFWLPVSSSHLISVPPNWQRHGTKKVRSFIPCHFIIFGTYRILQEVCVSQTSVISIPDLALADRAICRMLVLKTQNSRHKTRTIEVILSFIHIDGRAPCGCTLTLELFSITIEQFLSWVSKGNWLVLHHCATHPVKRKTNRVFFAPIFLRFVSATCNYFEFCLCLLRLA